MADSPCQPTLHRPRRALAVGESAVAMPALSGAFALAVGAIDLGTAVNGRLPFESPVFSGAALQTGNRTASGSDPQISGGVV